MNTKLASMALAMLTIFALVSRCTAFTLAGTEFTYQGRLDSVAGPATGTYDLLFTIYDSTNLPGTIVAGPLTNSATAVSNGLFTVSLDFGTNVFNLSDRWLEVGVRTNDAAAFVTLAPRQHITSAPYAITAQNAGALLGNLSASQLTGTISAAQLPAAVVTNNQSGVNFSGSFTGNGGGLTNLNALTLGGAGSNAFWQTMGNAGTTPGPNFIGTIDNQPLEIHVNGTRALRIEPQATSAPSLVGGYYQNSVAGFHGAVVAGGGTSAAANGVSGNYAFIGAGYGANAGNNSAIVAGAYNNSPVNYGFIGTGLSNTNLADYSFIGGGAENYISPGATNSFIGGGTVNSAEGAYSTVVGGGYNQAIGRGAFVGGGGGFDASGGGPYPNAASGDWSVVGGGYASIATGTFCTVGGGIENFSGGEAAVVAGGDDNVASGTLSTVGGGWANGATGPGATVAGGGYNGDPVTGYGPNAASGPASFVGGGVRNTASAGSSVVAGGANNSANANASAVAGGSENLASGDHGFVGGGQGNSATGPYAVLGGGVGNVIQSNQFAATIAGGAYNAIESGSDASVIAGGTNNVIAASRAVVGGGEGNINDGNYATVGGGYYNTNSGFEATVAGGHVNTASGSSSTVGGGGNNVSSGYNATVPGGFSNVAAGQYSLAAGQQAQALYSGDFVWADSEPGSFASTANDQFCIRAQGGLQLSPNTSAFFGSQTRQMLNLWSTHYGIGVQSTTTYFRSDFTFSWFKGGVHSDNPNDPGTGGTELMRLASNGNLDIAGAFGSLSDRNAKEGLQSVNALEVLEKVAALPVWEWRYKTDASARHLGPMAQDFYAAFGLNGADDTHITTVDEGGVALAAIQGLNQKLQEKDAELQNLKEKNILLERRLSEVEAIVAQAANRK